MKFNSDLNLKKIAVISFAFITLIGCGFLLDSQAKVNTNNVAAANARSLNTENIINKNFTLELNDQDSLQQVVAEMFQEDSFLKVSELQHQIFTDQDDFIDLTSVNYDELGNYQAKIYLGNYDPMSKVAQISKPFDGEQEFVPGVHYFTDINLTVVDTTAPTINLTKESVEIEYDAGFDALDYVDSITDNSNLTIEPVIDGTIDTQEPGEQSIKVVATDASGNSTERTINVTVGEKPAPPVSSGNGNISTATPAYGVSGMISLINNERIARGIAPLSTASYAAQQAAQVRAQEASGGNVSHYRPDGSSYRTALDQFGVRYNNAVEVLVINRTANGGLNWWLNSPAHRSYILSPAFSTIAVGYHNGMWSGLLMN